MKREHTGSVEHHFADLKDPRVDRTKLHSLLDIVVITIRAVICGADSGVEVESFGCAKHEWLRTFLALPNGIPSHDTFGRVFAMLDPEQFQACLLGWIRAVSEMSLGQVVAIDGKTLRRSHDRALGKGAIVMVSAWATANNWASPGFVDRGLSKGPLLPIVQLLVGIGAEIVQCRVAPTEVVERLDVEEHLRPGLVSGMIHAVMN